MRDSASQFIGQKQNMHDFASMFFFLLFEQRRRCWLLIIIAETYNMFWTVKAYIKPKEPGCMHDLHLKTQVCSEQTDISGKTNTDHPSPLGRMKERAGENNENWKLIKENALVERHGNVNFFHQANGKKMIPSSQPDTMQTILESWYANKCVRLLSLGAFCGFNFRIVISCW